MFDGRFWCCGESFACRPAPVCVQGLRGVGSLFAAEAGEGRLVLGVDGRGVVVTAGAAARGVVTAAGGVTATGSAATAALGAVTTVAAAGTAARTATAATAGAAAGGALGLDVALVDLDDLLLLLLALALGLSAGAGHEVLLLALDLDGLAPLLVGALVGAADLEAGVEGSLLLELLGEVVGVGDVLVLGLLGLLLGGLLSGGLLLLALGDGLASLLVLELGVALGGTPAVSGLLLRVGAAEWSIICCANA